MIGWVATLADGTEVIEGPGGWDEIPTDATVAKVELRELATGKILGMIPDRVSFYAYTEAIGAIGGGAASAKVIGGVRSDGTVDELRFDFIPQHRTLTAPGVIASALRRGSSPGSLASR